MNFERSRLAGAGTQTAGLAFAGQNPPSNGAKTEKYDGTSWTATADLNNTRHSAAGCGTQTAALVAGGSGSPLTTEIFSAGSPAGTRTIGTS